ncbi:Glycine--tRNA ligase [bioreactor metagenome]|uniref:glycine--tRNA ligase n=1 Tax=bioreactor metagenome TaxID=1076179 RepID=A0A644V7D3_9ZZZZ
MQEIVAFLKSRGFVFPSSEIYGGFNGVYDYGHYGYLLLENIKKAWMKSMIQERNDVLALDSGIFMHPMTWKASGHVDTFNDPQVDCKHCKTRFRADHILEKFGINADKQGLDFLNTELDKLRAEKKLVCENCGKAELTEAKVFSLMVKSNLGSPTDALSEENVVYLRPETCGGIYLEYKNTLDSLHPKLPFGMAQIGKAFRNEIVTKQFVFRTREFEQMEMQYFFNPKALEGKATEEHFEDWKNYRMNFYYEYGIDRDSLKWYKHEKLAHYASDAYDIEYKYKMLGDDFKELEGIHARGDWDLSQHSKFSGKDLSYFDEETRERFIPHIIETSAGVARTMLAFIDNAYTKEEVKEGEERIVLKLDKRISPVKVAIFPLMKKEELVNPAREIWKDLSKKYFCEFDTSGSIGKRYRRQDEIGTPYCITFDYESLEDNSVTVRDRDTMSQERIKIVDLRKYLEEKFEF